MLSRIPDALLAAVLLYAMFAVVYGNIVAQSAVGKAGLLLVAAVVIGLVALRRAAIIAFASRSVERVRVSGGILVCLATGLAAIFAWGLGFPGTPQSDSAAYLQLARGLAFDGTCADPAGLAFWPPGLLLALVPFFGCGARRSSR